jgi:hypothetical protein
VLAMVCCAALVAHGCAAFRAATATAPTAPTLRLHRSGSAPNIRVCCQSRILTNLLADDGELRQQCGLA